MDPAAGIASVGGMSLEALAVPSAAPAAVLRARGVRKTCGSGKVAVHALQGVDLDLHEGELVRCSPLPTTGSPTA